MREELALCDAWQIGHSTFLSLDEVDQDKALAYRRWRASLCPECGTTRDDWIDPEVNEFYDPPRYEAWVDECHGCAALATRRRELERAVPKDTNDGRYKTRIAPFDPTRTDVVTSQVMSGETGDDV